MVAQGVVIQVAVTEVEEVKIGETNAKVVMQFKEEIHVMNAMNEMKNKETLDEKALHLEATPLFLHHRLLEVLSHHRKVIVIANLSSMVLKKISRRVNSAHHQNKIHNNNNLKLSYN